MTLAVTLAQAAGLAWDNADVHWITNGLKNTLTNFWSLSIDSFPESDVNSNPVANWLAVIANQASLMDATSVPLDQMANATRSVYGVCWMAQFLLTANLITSAQGASLLAAYNATFGAP